MTRVKLVTTFLPICLLWVQVFVHVSFVVGLIVSSACAVS